MPALNPLPSPLANVAGLAAAAQAQEPDKVTGAEEEAKAEEQAKANDHAHQAEQAAEEEHAAGDSSGGDSHGSEEESSDEQESESASSSEEGSEASEEEGSEAASGEGEAASSSTSESSIHMSVEVDPAHMPALSVSQVGGAGTADAAVRAAESAALELTKGMAALASNALASMGPPLPSAATARSIQATIQRAAQARHSLPDSPNQLAAPGGATEPVDTPLGSPSGDMEPSKSAASDAPSGSMRFLAIGDWGCGANAMQTQVAAAMDKFARSQDGIQFVVSVGDNFYPSGVDSVNDAQWKKTFEDVYSQESLQARWYAVLGNHDWRGNADAQVEYTKSSKRWYMPSYYYDEMVEVNGVKLHLIMLDTQKLIDGDEEQLRWLSTKLVANGSDSSAWRVVIGHHPIFSYGNHGGHDKLRTLLAPKFKDAKLHLYVSGHDHLLEHISHDGTEYVVSGSGCRLTTMKDTSDKDLKFGREANGFAYLEATRDSLKVVFVDQTAEPVHDFTIKS